MEHFENRISNNELNEQEIKKMIISVKEGSQKEIVVIKPDTENHYENGESAEYRDTYSLKEDNKATNKNEWEKFTYFITFKKDGTVINTSSISEDFEGLMENELIGILSKVDRSKQEKIIVVN